MQNTSATIVTNNPFVAPKGLEPLCNRIWADASTLDRCVCKLCRFRSHLIAFGVLFDPRYYSLCVECLGIEPKSSVFQTDVVTALTNNPWSYLLDSNQPPVRYNGTALPDELRQRMGDYSPDCLSKIRESNSFLLLGRQSLNQSTNLAFGDL